MDIKSFQRALAQIAEERGISAEKVIETIESAIATAYKKDYGQKDRKLRPNLTLYQVMLSFGK